MTSKRNSSGWFPRRPARPRRRGVPRGAVPPRSPPGRRNEGGLRRRRLVRRHVGRPPLVRTRPAVAGARRGGPAGGAFDARVHGSGRTRGAPQRTAATVDDVRPADPVPRRAAGTRRGRGRWWKALRRRARDRRGVLVGRVVVRRPGPASCVVTIPQADLKFGYRPGRGVTEDAPEDAPGVVAGVNGIATVAAGEEHTVILANDGRAWAWGARAEREFRTVREPRLNTSSFPATRARGPFPLPAQRDARPRRRQLLRPTRDLGRARRRGSRKSVRAGAERPRELDRRPGVGQLLRARVARRSARHVLAARRSN